MDFNQEQIEIIEIINAVLKGHSGSTWGKFQGDAIPRIIAHFLGKHLSPHLKVVGPNVFIEDNSTEFDLMIVDYEAKSLEFTSAYHGDNVRGVIEVKKLGIFARRDELGEKLKKIRDNLESALFSEEWDKDGITRVKKARTNCKAAYISISETVNPVRQGSIRYGDITRQALEPYPAFILSDLRNGKIQLGQWQGFVALWM